MKRMRSDTDVVVVLTGVVRQVFVARDTRGLQGFHGKLLLLIYLLQKLLLLLDHPKQAIRESASFALGLSAIG